MRRPAESRRLRVVARRRRGFESDHEAVLSDGEGRRLRTAEIALSVRLVLGLRVGLTLGGCRFGSRAVVRVVIAAGWR
jgi:hypothetical protein